MTQPSPILQIAVFASGTGSNARRLMEHFQGHPHIRIKLILTDNPKAGVSLHASEMNVEWRILERDIWSDGEQLLELLHSEGIGMIVLAGYLRFVPEKVTRNYRGRILNIHPSLLPKYGGKGMYGTNVHEAVLAAGESESGITIHHVNEEYDAGAVIRQEKLRVQPGWGVAELQAEIHKLEHRYFPETVEQTAKSILENTDQKAEMTERKPIRSALISVFHKEGLDGIVNALHADGVALYSTGGTAEYMRGLGAEVNEVADLTAYPSILGGRVKTLHPKVFGGILARRHEEQDRAELAEFEIPELDLVIVDLYPFEDTVASGASEQAIIEKIDIGGISLIRAAAKNFRDVAVVASQAEYGLFEEMYKANGGALSLDERRLLAGAAFQVSSHYDSQIYLYVHPAPDALKVSEAKSMELRYGENPHQKARFYGDLENRFEQLGGKPLSYNNLLDIDAALNLIAEFDGGKPCFAIFKHTNPCGVALGDTVREAWTRALQSDPVSAFGGILITNGTVDADTAQDMQDLFFEVLIANDFSADALEILQSKKKRILLKRLRKDLPVNYLRSSAGGILMQERDNLCGDPTVYPVLTERKPTAAELADVAFGERVGKHLKSNAIAIVKNGQLIGSGCGQTSRVDALKQAVAKAGERGFGLEGSVLYSDAFFPFSDSVEFAHSHGIECVAEPGGSIRDEDTIKYCESRSMCLIFTKDRHFKH